MLDFGICSFVVGGGGGRRFLLDSGFGCTFVDLCFHTLLPISPLRHIGFTWMLIGLATILASRHIKLRILIVRTTDHILRAVAAWAVPAAELFPILCGLWCRRH